MNRYGQIILNIESDMGIQKIDTFDIDTYRILEEINTFIFSIPEFEDQICLQGNSKDMDPFFGSRRLEELEGEESDFKHSLFPELDYTNSIIEDLNLFRTRIMRLPKKSCLSYHKDPTKRIHIPIDTNDSCFLLIDKLAHNLPNDNCAYLVDTTKPHTAINASFEPRTHLVGVTYDY